MVMVPPLPPLNNYNLFILLPLLINLTSSMVRPKFSIIPHFILSLLSLTISPSTQNPCSTITPQVTNYDKPLTPQPFQILTGSFHTNGTYLGLEPNPHPTSPSSTVLFLPLSTWETSTPGVLHIKGNLHLLAGDSYILPGRPVADKSRYATWSGRHLGTSHLDGYWSTTDGFLCMTGDTVGIQVGGNHTQLHSLLTLNVTRNPSILTSLITGTLKSLDSVDPFKPISIVAYNHLDHFYTLNNSCSRGVIKSLAIEPNPSMCSILRLVSRMSYKLDHTNTLSHGFGSLGLNPIQCSDQYDRFQMYMTFSNTGTLYKTITPFLPNVTLVGEGVWNNSVLCMTACRIINGPRSPPEGSYIGDCSIGVRLEFLETITLKNRSRVTGEIWSRLGSSKNDGFFDSIAIRSFENQHNLIGIPGLKYEYTEVERLKIACSSFDRNFGTINSTIKRSYPNGASPRDMRFRVHGSGFSGKFWPLFLGERYQRGYNIFYKSQEQKLRRLNVSYTIELQSLLIAAEGMYDSDTGLLCMVGCRSVVDSLDCELLINVQFPPLNPVAGDHLVGSVISTREKSDSLYFNPMQFSSHVPYIEQTLKIVKRMDFEIIMVIVSLTLACASIASQLLHMKRQPDVVPAISILMSAILALGLVVPLVLNIEGDNKKHKNLWNEGWLEAYQVIVRLIMMVAFLLQVRLLQLIVSARCAADSMQVVEERRVLMWCIPMYVVGGVVAWIVKHGQHKLWKMMVGYGGMVLDGFLIPQVVMNGLSMTESKGEGPLVGWFYGGMTLVRVVPHLYGVYRGGRIFWGGVYGGDQRNGLVIDVVMPIVGMVLVVIVWLQQRFGGRVVIPLRFRGGGGYEQVGVSEVEL